jgi:hypothetical protein
MTVASLWPDRDDERADYLYWYWAWQVRSLPERVQELPPELLLRVMELRNRLASHPEVAAVAEDLHA